MSSSPATKRPIVLTRRCQPDVCDTGSVLPFLPLINLLRRIAADGDGVLFELDLISSPTLALLCLGEDFGSEAYLGKKKNHRHHAPFPGFAK